MEEEQKVIGDSETAPAERTLYGQTVPLGGCFFIFEAFSKTVNGSIMKLTDTVNGGVR